jgi:hypothetical protein
VVADASGPEQTHVQANQAINDCIERGLGVIGVSGKQVVLILMKSRFGISAERMPDDPEGLVSALRSIFGLGAAPLLEAIIHEFRKYRPQNEVEKELIESFADALREGQLSVEAGIV